MCPVLTVLPMLLCGGAPAQDLGARAARLHAEAIVVDTHQDVPETLAEKWADFGARGATRHVDLPRLKEGGVGAAFFAVYVPPSLAEAGRASAAALDQLDIIDRLVAAHPEALTSATSVAEIRAAKKAGRIALLKGLEGGHVLEDSLARLRQFARLGARYLTLTHSAATHWADSSGAFWEHDWTPKGAQPHGGLTEFGKRVVREANRLGVAVDVSHASDAALAQALETSRAPVFASHSSCRAIADMPRNLTDDQIKAIAAKGGVVMINFGSTFLDPKAYDAMRAWTVANGAKVSAIRAKHKDDPRRRGEELEALWRTFPAKRTPWTAVVDHLEHALAIAPGAVGIGSDYDGIQDTPSGLEDVSKLPRLTEELLRRGHSEDEVRGVLGENFLRYLTRVEEAAASLRSEPPDATPFTDARARPAR